MPYNGRTSYPQKYRKLSKNWTKLLIMSHFLSWKGKFIETFYIHILNCKKINIFYQTEPKKTISKRLKRDENNN